MSTTKRRRIAGEPAPGPRAATTVAPEPAAAKKPAFLTGRDASQPAPPPPPATGTQQRSILRFWPWLVLLVGIALAVVGALRFFGGEELDRSGAAGAATAATETIFSFTSDTLDDHEAASKALMTASFQEEFDTIAPALADIAPQREFEVEARVQEAGIVPCGDDCDAGRVTVLVFFDQVRLIAGVDDPTVLDNRAEVTLVRDGDDWLVDDIRAV